MPEPTQTELIFDTEDQKIEKLSTLQERFEAEPDNKDLEAELLTVTNAKVKEEPKPEMEPEGEPQETPPEPQTGETVPQTPAATWFPKQYIPKDTYKDPVTGEEKPFWTYDDPNTGPERLSKTLVHGQRRIRKLEDELLPAAHKEGEQAGYDKAKSQYETEMAELKKQVEALKKTPAHPQYAPNPQPQQPYAPQPQQPVMPQPFGRAPTQADIVRLQAELTKVSNVNSDDYDVTEHTKKLQEFQLAQSQYMNAQLSQRDARLTQMQTEWQNRTKAEEERKKKEAEDAQKLKAAEEAQANARKAWDDACVEIDAYAKTNNLATNQSFKDMTHEASTFHVKLARALTNKYNVSDAEIENAGSRYARQDPTVIQAMEAAALLPPTNYDRWSELNQIDALRTGYKINPTTMAWERDPNVRFPDMDSAAGYYEKITGKTLDKIREAKVDAQKKITQAINKRDLSVVQADESKTTGSTSGEELTEEQAAQIINKYQESMEEVVYKVRQGDLAPLDEYNRARMRLGLKPFDPNDIER